MPKSGQVFYNGTDITGKSIQTRSRNGLIRTFQTPKVFEQMTVLENLMVGSYQSTSSSFLANLMRLRSARRDASAMQRRALEVSEKFGLQALLATRAGELPAGQRRIVELAMACAASPKILLLDVDAAVSAALAAQRSWARVNARDRGKILIEASRRLAEHVEELAKLVALESGKALRTECRPEAAATADVFAFFGGLAPEIKGETVPLKATSLTYTSREPVGVVAAILPWNVPLILMAHKIAPALVAGNAVVAKFAEETPFGVLRAIQILNTVLPPGLLNVVSGNGPGCGGPLVAHRDVSKVTFTGSVETGRAIARAAADKLIPVTLELGGKSPMLVLEDADLEQAIDGAVTGMRFTRQGQSCTAASRMLVHESLVDKFVQGLQAKVNAMKMGHPLSEHTDIGAIISRQQFDKISTYIALGENETGAIAHRCSTLPRDPKLKSGLFVQPIIYTGLSPESRQYGKKYLDRSPA